MKSTLLLAAFATLLFSCKKDSTLNDNRLAGTWIYQGSYLNANYISENEAEKNTSTILLKGMTINNTGELTFDPVTDSFHFSNYYYEVDLPQTTILHKRSGEDSTYITRTRYNPGISDIATTYTLSGKNSLKISGVLTQTRADRDVPLSSFPFKSEFTVGWSGDTLLLLHNSASFLVSMAQNATLKFVRK